MRLRTSNTQRSTGFTLIEVLVAVVILSIGIVGVLHAYDASIVALGVARDRLWATSLIKDKLADAEAGILEQKDATGLSSDGWFGPPHEGFRWDVFVGNEITFAGDQDDSIGRLYEATVAVWRDGANRVYTVETYLRARPEKNPEEGM